MYAQAENTGRNPAAGSVSVPVNVPVDVMVPRSSISAPEEDERNRSVIPVPRVMVPVIVREAVDVGLCQKLAVLRVPSAFTSRWVVIA